MKSAGQLAVLISGLLLFGCRGSSSRLFQSGDTTTNYTVFKSSWMANTGIAYNPTTNELLFAGWDSQKDFSFVKVTDTDLNERRRFNLPNNMDCVQGIAVNTDNGSLIVWGYERGTNRTTPLLFSVDINTGDLVESFVNPAVEDSPGMIAYQSPGKLWIKSNENMHARLYDLLGMVLVKDVDTGIKGEGVALRNGSLWVHGNCKIRKIDLASKAVKDFVSPNPLCSEEGLAFDSEGNLFVGDDDGYHFNQENGNQVWKIPTNLLN